MRKLVLVILGSLLFFSCAMTRDYENYSVYFDGYGTVSTFTESAQGLMSNVTSVQLGFDAKISGDLLGVHTGFGAIFPFSSTISDGEQSVTATKKDASIEGSLGGINFVLGPSFKLINKDKVKLFISPVIDIEYLFAPAKYAFVTTTAIGFGGQVDSHLYFTDKFYVDLGILLAFPTWYTQTYTVGKLTTTTSDTHFGVKFIPRLGIGLKL